MVNYPKEWDKIKLSELMTPYNGLLGKSGDDFINGKEKYINYLSVFNNTVIESATEKVNINNGEIQNIVNKGDVLFTQSSETAEEVGMASTYLGDEKVYLNSFCFGARKKREFDSFFMVSLLRSKAVREKISKEGQGSTRYNLSPTRLLNIEINMPKDVDEQKAISKVLLSFDKHIENLEELIAKKKMIRDGAVEDLMSGKTRLDGFDGEWEIIKFSKYFTKLKNNTFSRDMLSSNGKVGNIHYGDILIKFGPVLKSEDNIPKVKADVVIRNPAYLKENDVIIADTAEDETVGKATQIGDINFPLVSGLHAIPCRPNFKSAPKFLGYYINSNAYHNQLLPYITGIKVSSISKQSIDATMLYIPTDINEQKAIADILSVMDEEIEELRQEKKKIEKIKAGAMDDLLTGKIRLVKEA